MNTDPIDPAMQGMAEFFAKSYRTPILRRPDEYGMAYEDVFFPSMDGVPLEGWFIPAADSTRLVICNHFMPGNRYGYPGHLEPWKNFGGFEVNFLPQYKALHDAGYNVLAYDLRNHGRSGSGNGGLVGIGLLECRDVIGSLRYAKARPDTANMATSLLSICPGCNSTIVAMDKHPRNSPTSDRWWPCSLFPRAPSWSKAQQPPRWPMAPSSSTPRYSNSPAFAWTSFRPSLTPTPSPCPHLDRASRPASHRRAAPERRDGGQVKLSTFIPLKIRKRGASKVVVRPERQPDAPGKLASQIDQPLLVALTWAFYWQQLLDDGVVGSGSKIAQREDLHHSTVNELLRLTLLEPAIIQDHPGRAAAPVHEPAVVPAQPAANRLDGAAGSGGWV